MTPTTTAKLLACAARETFVRIPPRDAERFAPFGVACAYFSPVYVIVQITPDFGTVYIGVGIWKFTKISP
jgi:hypothetical protein